jgi:hypothetical protein
MGGGAVTLGNLAGRCDRYGRVRLSVLLARGCLQADAIKPGARSLHRNHEAC